MDDTELFESTNETAQWNYNTRIVQDHCHITGEYRGPTHSICNLAYNYKYWKIPVFFHNMKGYDGHFVLQWMKCSAIGVRDPKAIPINKEKFQSISFKYFKVIDSLNFFNSSLAKLVDNLMGKNEDKEKELAKIKRIHQELSFKPNIDKILTEFKSREIKLTGELRELKERGMSKFKFLEQEFNRDIGKNLPEEKKEEAKQMLFEKGHWPYEWFTSVKQLHNTKLPLRKDFSKRMLRVDEQYLKRDRELNNSKFTKGKSVGEWLYEEISEEDYNKCRAVWNMFNMKTMRDFHDLYLKLDVILLADVLYNMQDLMWKSFGIDFTHYVSLPAYAWDVLLNTRQADNSKVRLDVFSEEEVERDMYTFVERGIRGGMCMIPHRYAKANNKYLPKQHQDPSKPSEYLFYVDANQLYTYAMQQPLPYDNYQWTGKTNWTREEILNLTVDSDTGYIFEVDLEYPQYWQPDPTKPAINLHDYHNDYPLAPHPETLDLSELSPSSQEIRKKLNLIYSKTPKLCTTLKDKTKYVVHYRNLQFYLKHGMKLVQVHKVLQFRQKAWMKLYVDEQTQKRKEAKDDFEKELRKLMCNAVFGKTMEDERGRIDFELVMNDGDKNKHFQRLVRSPFYKENIDIAFNKDLVGVSMRKRECVLSKPKAVGMSILDISKELMFRFYYDGLKEVYQDNITLCMTDTDSLEVRIQTEDLYKDLQTNPKVKTIYGL
jgi:hypothetical protein